MLLEHAIIPISLISDLKETQDHYIARGARNLYFISKETMLITTTISLAIDHEFGYKLTEVNDEACFVVVHSDSSEQDASFGDPKKAYLKSYKAQGEQWSYPLKTGI